MKSHPKGYLLLFTSSTKSFRGKEEIQHEISRFLGFFFLENVSTHHSLLLCNEVTPESSSSLGTPESKYIALVLASLITADDDNESRFIEAMPLSVLDKVEWPPPVVMRLPLKTLAVSPQMLAASERQSADEAWL